MRVLILLALLGAAMAVPKHQQRIVGGEATTIDKYPYMCNMEYGIFSLIWSHFCGGSLLTPTAVLSAAHCVYGDPVSRWRVRLGSSYASSGGSLHYVNRIIIHQQWDINALDNDNDIAVMRLSTPAVYSANVAPARIAGPNYILPAGTPVWSIGWGTLSHDGPAPDQLYLVQTNLIDQDICAERYAYLKTQPGYETWPDITPGMICAGILDVGGKDACNGDSGGPLADDGDVIVGVTSWGYKCVEAFYPGVNARVNHYSNWIVENASS